MIVPRNGFGNFFVKDKSQVKAYTVQNVLFEILKIVLKAQFSNTAGIL